MSRFYPLLLRLDNKPVLVVGGGRVAERKVESLLRCGARVFIVSRELTSGLKRLLHEGRLTFVGKDFSPEALDNKLLVIVGTDDMEFNTHVARLAKQKGIMVNVVDYPSECDFILPSVIRRGDLVIAISTSGKSPAFSKAMRKRLESLYGREYGIFLDIIAALRSLLIRIGASEEKKDKIFKKLWNSDMIDKIRKDDVEGIARLIAELGKDF